MIIPEEKKLKYTKSHLGVINIGKKIIYNFVNKSSNDNIDWKTVDSFGAEWNKFSNFSDKEFIPMGDEYFDIVDERMLNEDSLVLDVGCGTGRWTKYLAPKVRFIEAIDPSEAVIAAAKLLEEENNVRITRAEVSNIPFEKESFDFVFSLGVLHHIPNTKNALKTSVDYLKKGGYFLVYLYYDFENRGPLFKLLFHISDFLRKGIIKLPQKLKSFVCDVLAIGFYLPLIFIAKITKFLFPSKDYYKKIPLSWYVDKSFNVIRNDSLDRFGTPLEQRFSKAEIREMMEEAGLTDIRFSDNLPMWRAVGRKI